MTAMSDFLYHGTGIYALANIIDENRLNAGTHWGKPGEPNGPRLSASALVAASFIQYNMHWGEGGVLVLDRRLLMKDYQVIRYQDKTYGGEDWGLDEEEHVPLTSCISNLSRYLISIVCDPAAIEMAQEPHNLIDAKNECGWAFPHDDDQLAIAALNRLSQHALFNRWMPLPAPPRMGNWIDRNGHPVSHKTATPFRCAP